MKLSQLIQNKDLYLRMYAGITDFQRVLEIEVKAIEPMEKILKSYEKSKQGLLKLKETKPQEAEKKFQELMEEEVKFKPIPITKEEAKTLNFNVFEYRVIKEFIN